MWWCDEYLQQRESRPRGKYCISATELESYGRNTTRSGTSDRS